MGSMVAIFIVGGVALVLAVIGALGAWRRSGQLRRLEERVTAESERLRASFEAALREGAQDWGRAQSDLGLRIAGRMEESRESLLLGMGARLQEMHRDQVEALATARRSQDERLDRMETVLLDLVERFYKGMGQLENTLLEMAKAHGEQNARTASDLRDRLAAELAEMRRDNAAKLEAIRVTVGEKLHSTLEARLGESFKLVSERLEHVHRGLGEMQALASGVGDLKRVLTNVRSRGTFGEVQLESLLEQVLTPSQYEKNVATVPGGRERVEFAVRLPGPGDGGSIVYLPIDAKFPQEDYLRLQDAYDAGDPSGVDAARRALQSRFLSEGSTVRSKYLAPPHTTDFALLFVPTEGLYAEALRIPGLVERLQSESRVVLAGPTTLYAVLNSLQMGFRTLAIERRSSEVWKILGAVKTEFGKFGRSLAEVRKKLHEAGDKIDLSERRSRVMERTLRQVEVLPETDAHIARLEEDDQQ